MDREGREVENGGAGMGRVCPPDVGAQYVSTVATTFARHHRFAARGPKPYFCWRCFFSNLGTAAGLEVGDWKILLILYAFRVFFANF